MSLQHGTLLNHRYRVRRELGRGGLARAYLADDMLAGEAVVLKLVHRDAAGDVARFRAEMGLLRGIVHPQLTQVRDFGYLRRTTPIADGARRPFYTATFVDGPTLAELAGRPWSELAQPVADALVGLDALHALGIRHGDIKADNVIVSQGRGVLIDLSCAQRFSDAEPLVAGTPGAIAPELLSGDRPDARSDLFAVGVMLASLFPRSKRIGALADRLQADVPADRPPDVRAVLEAIRARVRVDDVAYIEPARLIGRDETVARLSGWLDALGEGRPSTRAVIVSGPPGVGASRLLREMKWDAQLRYDVIEGRARAPAAIGALLRRAIGRDVSPGIDGVREARRVLCERVSTENHAPVVLCLDDADELDDGERALWLALLRGLCRDDPIFVIAVDRRFDESAAAVHREQLGALTLPDVERWLKPTSAAGHARQVLALTGGFPATLHALAAALHAGIVGPLELRQTAAAVELNARRRAALDGMGAGAKRLLAHVAVRREPLGWADVAALEATADVAALSSGGWIVSQDGGVRLCRAAEAAHILERLDDDVTRDAYQQAVRICRQTLGKLPAGSEARSTATARLVELLLLSDRVAAAEELFETSRSLASSFPSRWRSAIRSLAERRVDATLPAAEIAEASGHPDEAIELLAALLRTRPGPDVRLQIALCAGAAYLRKGDALRAIAQLQRALGEASGDDLARAHDRLSRAHVRRSDYRQALTNAERGLAIAARPSLRADLHDDRGVALSFLGRADEARAALAAAAALHREAGDTRAQARSVSYRALAAYRAGDTPRAARGFDEAYELARACGAADLISYAAQNRASAHHQLGDFGLALDAYQAGIEIATMVADRHAEIMFRGNLAKLYADIGQGDRARVAATEAIAMAEHDGLVMMIGAATATLGEVALKNARSVGEGEADGDLAEAERLFAEARGHFEAEGAARERVECDIHLAACAVLAARSEDANALLDRAEEGADADDVRARIALCRAPLGQGDPEALSRLETALERARRCGQRDLEAEIAAALATAADARGAPVLARRHRARAMELWERAAATLPRAMRDGFWSRPARAAVKVFAGSDHAAPNRIDSPAGQPSAIGQRQLEHLLAINRKLSSSLDLEQVLSWTIDSALELTGAERGLVIVRGDEGFELIAARNIDASVRGPAEAAFSRGIAERVIAEGVPLTAVDAMRDERFESRHSIHAMRLKSVLAVPIRSHGGIAGALYLDHRYKAGVFEPRARQLLSAFADQVAIALHNAKLVADLEARTKELERERRRIERLAKGQAKTIDRLVGEVKQQREVLQTRYDYGNIVGRSPAMAAVFDALDRVIDTAVPVLIEGESGSGKELIARAIHYNGPRKDKPWVAINCGAVPELLLEAELFGHVRGAFTGADQDRDGLLVSAEGGTVFLDELGEMPPAMQVKLLRVLQEGEVRPVGARRAVPTDIRLVCATNRDLAKDVTAGRFRADLFYRVGVVIVTLPPLRDRTEDIPELVQRISDSAATKTGRKKPRITQEALDMLVRHPWPGNVRELENVITKALLMAADGLITAGDLGLEQRTAPPDDRSAYRREEASRMLAALRRSGWNVTRAAKSLSIPRATFYRRMKRYGIRL